MSEITYDKDVVDRLVFSLGIVELISYYKLTCAKKIIVNNCSILILLQ